MITRMIAAAALASVLACGSAAANQPAKEAQATKETQATATDRINRSEARKLARDFVKEHGPRGARIGRISPSDGGYEVEILTVEGIPVRRLKIDGSGQIS